MANLTQHDVVTLTATALTAGVMGAQVLPWRMLNLDEETTLPALTINCLDRPESPRTMEVKAAHWRAVDTIHIEGHATASSDAAAGEEASRIAEAIKSALWSYEAWVEEWEEVAAMRTRLILDKSTNRRRIVAVVEVDVQHAVTHALPDGVPIDFMRLSIEPITPDGADVTAQVDL